MDSLHSLEELFSKFPGIGPRQAKRFVYYLLNKSPSYIKEFTRLVEEVKKGSAECEQCHRFFVLRIKDADKKNSGINSTGAKICSICADPTRDTSTLMIVARDSDFETVEKSGAYNGLYFILGGTVPVLDKEPDKRIRLKGLLERVTKMMEAGDKKSEKVGRVGPESARSNGPESAGSKLKEIILSLNATPDGEHTEIIVKEALQKVTKNWSLTISILGRGLSTGAELEYVDGETIKNALNNRR